MQNNIYDSEEYQTAKAVVNTYFTEDNLIRVVKEIGCSEFRLRISAYKTGEGTWNFTRGIITNGEGIIVADIKRNYSSFPYCFIEHPNGNTYLACGEDYQGYTIVNCNSGVAKTYIPEGWKHGWGFCWADIDKYVGEDAVTLDVEGCNWGAPFEIITYDFSDPDTLPLPEIDRRDADPDEGEDEDYEEDEEE